MSLQGVIRLLKVKIQGHFQELEKKKKKKKKKKERNCLFKSKHMYIAFFLYSLYEDEIYFVISFTRWFILYHFLKITS